MKGAAVGGKDAAFGIRDSAFGGKVMRVCRRRRVWVERVRVELAAAGP